DFVVWTYDDAADLGIRVLAARRYDFTNIEVVLVPGRDRSHTIQLHFRSRSGKLVGFPNLETSCGYGCCTTTTVLTGQRRLPTSADLSRVRSTRMRNSNIRAWPTRLPRCSIRRSSMAMRTRSSISNIAAIRG